MKYCSLFELPGAFLHAFCSSSWFVPPYADCCFGVLHTHSNTFCRNMRFFVLRYEKQNHCVMWLQLLYTASNMQSSVACLRFAVVS